LCRIPKKYEKKNENVRVRKIYREFDLFRRNARNIETRVLRNYAEKKMRLRYGAEDSALSRSGAQDGAEPARPPRGPRLSFE
jgi:hypothetical protein